MKEERLAKQDTGVTEFGNRMRAIRKDRGMKQTVLAERTGMCEISIREYERGKRLPNAYNLKRICQVLNISADYLLGLKVR